MKCDKCKKDCSKLIYEKGKTYEGIDKHHNPPEFLSDFLKEKWSGEFYSLCRDCHRKLHDIIIIMLNKKANNFKFIKSEYWILQKMNLKLIRESKEEIYAFTKIWIKKNENTKNTTK